MHERKQNSNTRRRWTRDELLKTLSLYCQIPFGKMHARNPAVVSFAQAVSRTPSAVALKLVNFASLDPELQYRGISGMSNTSVMDRSVWSEFYGSWEALAEAASEISTAPIPKECPTASDPPSGLTEVRRETTQRRGQSFFRSAVLAAYDGKCCITGIACDALLRASHIVPWSHDPALRLTPHNGLCMNALHDAAFDRGLITFSARFELQVSTRIRRELPETVYHEMFASRLGSQISMPERFAPSASMIEYHRTNIFAA